MTPRLSACPNWISLSNSYLLLILWFFGFSFGSFREKMFQEKVGMRNNSQKLLVVVTDGRSNDIKDNFSSVITLADERGVTRFAIGVKHWLFSPVSFSLSPSLFDFHLYLSVFLCFHLSDLCVSLSGGWGVLSRGIGTDCYRISLCVWNT